MTATTTHPILIRTFISFLHPFRLGASFTDLYNNQIVKEICSEATSTIALQWVSPLTWCTMQVQCISCVAAILSEHAPVLQLGLLTHRLCLRGLGWRLLSSTWQWKVSSSLSSSFCWRLANTITDTLYQWPVTSDHNTILLQKKFYYRQIRALLASTRPSTPGTRTIRQDQVNYQ